LYFVVNSVIIFSIVCVGHYTELQPNIVWFIYRLYVVDYGPWLGTVFTRRCFGWHRFWIL